jgi:antitoxin component YwqK of YwqJK toxin-antitoxin module
MEKINLKNFLFENFQTDNNICFSTKNPSIIKFINISESTEQLKTIKVKDDSQIPNDFTGIAEFPDGSKAWFLNGKVHRDNDLPAVENTSGYKGWYKNGEPHRENDLPAIEQSNGYKAWYLNGLRHRENDLPAIKYPDGSKEWWLNGKLHRETGPAIEHVDGYEEWWLNGQEYSEENWKKEIEKLNLRKHNPTSIDLFESIKVVF